MVKVSGLLATATVILCITKAFAASECVNNGTQEAVAEIVECSSYYEVVAGGMKATPGQEQLMKANLASATRLLNLGTQLGQQVGISHEATVARWNLHVDAMAKIVSGNTGNWPILLLKYADHCKAIADDPRSFLIDNLARECHVPRENLVDPSHTDPAR